MHTTRMRRRAAARRVCVVAAVSILGAALWAVAPAAAQQGAPSWQVQAPPTGRDPPGLQVPPNTTIVPRSSGGGKVPVPGGVGQVSLTALLTDDGQNIEQGLVWRVYRVGQGSEKATFLAQHRDDSPKLRL